jgi:AraC family transcriptional regulator
MSGVQELRSEDTIGILRMPGVDTHRSSAGLGWSRIFLSVQNEAPYQAQFGGVANHLVILHLDGPVSVTRGKGKAARTRTIASGGLFVHPAHRDLTVRLSGRLRTLHMYIDCSMIADAAGRDIEIAEELGASDPLLEQLMLSLDQAIHAYSDTSRLYVDSLGTAVAAQLAERHSRSPRTSSAVSRAKGLTERQLSIATSLMRERLQEGLSLAELATSVGLSESHFARAFRTRMGVPPHRYLMGLRLDQAQRLLRASDMSIAEVATYSGFSSQEHLTRVMRAWLDVTPGALRTTLR